MKVFDLFYTGAAHYDGEIFGLSIGGYRSSEIVKAVDWYVEGDGRVIWVSGSLYDVFRRKTYSIEWFKSKIRESDDQQWQDVSSGEFYVDVSSGVVGFDGSKMSVGGKVEVEPVILIQDWMGMSDIDDSVRQVGVDEYRAVILKVYKLVERVRVEVSGIDSFVSDVSWLGMSGAGVIETSDDKVDWFPGYGWLRIKGGSGEEVVHYRREGRKFIVRDVDRGLLGTSSVEGSSSDVVELFSPLLVGVENVVDGKVQVVVDEFTEPVGVAWGFVYDKVKIDKEGELGIWVKKSVHAGAYGVARYPCLLKISGYEVE